MKKKFWSVMLIVALLGVVCCLGFIAWHILSDIKAEQGYEEVGALVTESRDENASAEESGDESAAESVLTVEEIEAVEFTGEREGEEAPLPEDIFSGLGSRVDFDALHAINPDLYAWILINDTNINYPVAQHPADDSFYLNHDMYGDARFAGCLYTMRANSKDFTDPNTVIYGHNMKSGSMFHTLHYFENAEFFDKHPYIYVYTADRILVYEIFASRFFTDDNLLYAYNFQDQTSFQKFLDDIIYSNRNMRNNLRSDCEVTTNDRILTLSTCVGGSPEERFLVHGKLLWEGNEDELAEAQRKIEEGTLSGAQTADSMVPEVA